MRGWLKGASINRAQRRRFVLIAAALLSMPYAIGAQPFGLLEREGIRATVKPREYGQAASFYIARQLPSRLVEEYARPCVILVTMQNQGEHDSISTRLADWRVRTAGGHDTQIRGRSSWLAELGREGVSHTVRMAFEWAQFPEDVDLNAGDSVQGMLSMPVARGVQFNLNIRWKSGKDEREATVSEIRCE